MNESDEKHLDAAEYVIGTLTPAERAAFDARLEEGGDESRDVAYWTAIMARVSAFLSPVEPPKTIWPRIERQIGTADEPVRTTNNEVSPVVVELAQARASRTRWRFAAIAATLVAALLGGWMASEQMQADPGLGDRSYVAVVRANADQPALVVQVDPATGVVTVRSLALSAPEGKSLELWHIPEGGKAVSAGLVETAQFSIKDVEASPGDLFAISVEPVGGAPDGVATGPVVYTGTLQEFGTD